MRKYIGLCCISVFMSSKMYSSYVPAGSAYPRGIVLHAAVEVVPGLPVPGLPVPGLPANNSTASLMQEKVYLLEVIRELRTQNSALRSNVQSLSDQNCQLMHNVQILTVQNDGLRFNVQQSQDKISELRSNFMKTLQERDGLKGDVHLLSQQIAALRKELDNDRTTQERNVRMVNELVD